MITIRATFIGQHGSLGYQKFNEYSLRVPERPMNTITRLDGSGMCTYGSVYAFIDNWADIKVMSKP